MRRDVNDIGCWWMDGCVIGVIILLTSEEMVLRLGVHHATTNMYLLP